MIKSTLKAENQWDSDISAMKPRKQQRQIQPALVPIESHHRQ